MAGDQKQIFLALGITFPVVATLAVAFRFQARKMKRLRYEADDWTILVALVILQEFSIRLCSGFHS